MRRRPRRMFDRAGARRVGSRRYLGTVGQADWEAASAIWTRWQGRPELGETFFGSVVEAYGPTRRLAPGRRLPAATLVDLDSGETLALDEIAGLTLVEVWATWCGGCRAALPIVRESLAASREAGVEIDFIGLDVHEGPETVRSFWAEDEWTPPRPGRQLGVAEPEARAALLEALEIGGVPNFILVGPEGRILESSPQLDAERLEQRIAYWSATLASG